MQGEVHFKPPEPYADFGNKAPPTSWVEENIGKYLNLQSQKEFLTDLLSFTRTLQKERLAKERPTAPSLSSSSSVPLPEEGTEKDVANAATYNALQPQLKEEIETLSVLVSILGQAEPKHSKKLKEMEMKLRQMIRAFPKLSDSQIESLGPMLAQMTQWVRVIPMEDQRKFWDQQMVMIQTMYESLGESINSCKSQINHLEHLVKQLPKLKKAQENIQNAFSQLESKSLRSPEAMLSALQTLATINQELPANPQKALGKYLQHLAKGAAKSGPSLPSLISATLVNQWASSFLKNTPNATQAQLNSYLQQVFQGSNLSQSKIPFIKNMGEEIEKSLQKESLHFGAPAAKVPLILEQRGRLVPNSSLVKTLMGTLSVNQKAIDEMSSLHTAALNTYDEAISKCQNVTAGLKQSIEIQVRMKEHLGQAGAWGAGQSAGSGSLPNQFKHALLDHYLPTQEAYLFELANILMFDNFGASLGNVLLNMMTDFGSAANNFDFFNSLNASGDQYSGSYQAAIARRMKEMYQCDTDMEEIMKALMKIHFEINDINNNPNFTSAQKQQMIGQLENIQSNLETSLNQVGRLLSILGSISISPGSDDKHFKISGPKGWQEALSQQEGVVINGDPSNPYPGGLVQTQGLVQNFQQTYSDQGQMEQMQTQLMMTELQQAVSIISTGLQLLNQAYLTVAKGIN